MNIEYDKMTKAIFKDWVKGIKIGKRYNIGFVIEIYIAI
jgi:proline dehydrogenase